MDKNYLVTLNLVNGKQRFAWFYTIGEAEEYINEFHPTSIADYHVLFVPNSNIITEHTGVTEII